MQTILVVNGNKKRISELTSLFEPHYDFKAAQDSKSAMELAVKLDADLILLGSKIDNVDSLDLCQKFIQNPFTKHTPVIVTSDEVSEQEEEVFLSIGAIDYFSSTTLKSILFNRVRNHLKTAKKLKELELIACTDGLTGLANKMQFTTILNKEWHAAIRGNYSLAAIMVDIDQFKLYNDQFGHIEGDECLKKIARAVDETRRRDEDVASRFGGEEFVLLLPYTDLKGAHRVAEKLLKNIRELKIPHSESAIHPMVTASAGVSACIPNHFDRHLTTETLLADADSNLYRAKEKGRNCYV